MKKKSGNTPIEDLFKVKNHEGHARPMSRREFLAQSAIASCTSFIIPSFTGLLSNVIYAQTAPGGIQCSMPVSNRAAFFVFDEAGGGNIAGGNVMVGKTAQKDYLASYKRLGLPEGLNPAKASDMIDEQFGLAFHKDSPMLLGMLMGASKDVRDRCDGIVICAASDNDTRNNPHNPAGYIAKSGTVGSLAPAAGRENSDTGGNSTGYSNPQFKQVVINNPDSATGLVDPGRLATDLGRLASNDVKKQDQFGREAALKASNAITKLSQKSLTKINDADMPLIIKNLTSCGYINVPATMNRYTKEAVDPRLDPTFFTPNPANAAAPLPFGLANNNDDTRRVATMAKLALSGYTGPATFSRGGYDYHSNNRRDNNANALSETGDGGTDDRDFFMGLMIGKTLQAAHDMGKPCFIYCFSDGSVTAGDTIQDTRGRDNITLQTGKYMWAGDCEDCASVFLMAYRPGVTRAEKSILTNKYKDTHQIGSFKVDNEMRAAVDRNATLVSNNVKQLSQLIVLNYLAAHGETGRMLSVVGENPFAGKEDQYIAFEKIV